MFSTLHYCQEPLTFHCFHQRGGLMKSARKGNEQQEKPNAKAGNALQQFMICNEVEELSSTAALTYLDDLQQIASTYLIVSKTGNNNIT